MFYLVKRNRFTDKHINDVYRQFGNIIDTASALGISYPTAVIWLKECGVKTKRQGYTAPSIAITGAQCRHARELLGMTRNEFCVKAGVGLTAIRTFELGQSIPRKETQSKIERLFDQYGVVFYDDGTFSVS